MVDKTDGGIDFEPVNMRQTMSVLANAVVVTIAASFTKPEDSDEDKIALTYVCLSVFLYQLCVGAKHKDKMVGVLQAVIDELKEPSEGPTT